MLKTKDEEMFNVLLDCIFTVYNCMVEIVTSFCNEFGINQNLLLTELQDAYSFRNLDIELQADYDDFEFEIINHQVLSEKRIQDSWYITLEYCGPSILTEWTFCARSYKFKIHAIEEPILKFFKHSYTKRVFAFSWENYID
jgi:hypothetical protein